MTRKHVPRAILTAAVLSAVLSVGSIAQVAPSAGQPNPAASGAQPQSAQQAFRITPVRPIAELRAEALKAKPPEDKDAVLTAKLVGLAQIAPYIHLDIRYATANNFLGEPLYEQARALLERSAVVALLAVNEKLRKQGYELLVYDAYRPWYVSKIIWEATPPDKRQYVDDPAEGSAQNRGCAVDVGLYEFASYGPASMPSEFDEMSPRAHADYAGGARDERAHRKILRKAMESEGFVQRPNKWWHYDYEGSSKYKILNLPFDQALQAQPRLGPGVVRPRLLQRVSPMFTDEAKRKHCEGVVFLDVVVDENGRAGEIYETTRKLGCGLDEEAVKAVKQWQFQPATKDGKPVAVEIDAVVGFHLY